MAKLREKGAVHRNGRRRGPKRRGVTVDMVPTTETVELADLTAPPGRLWLPVALGRAKRRAHAATENEEAYNNFLITFCLLNTTAYHAEPWLYGMSIFLQQKSGCLEDKSLLRTYKLPVVEELLAKHPGRFLDPSGFIYHETRCGSTLAANMLAAVPTNIMNSESPVPEVAASACRTCTEGVHLRLVRSVLRLMSPADQGHTHSFFKFTSSKNVKILSKAFPDVPWIYLFRDPVEVMASNLKGAWRRREDAPGYRPKEAGGAAAKNGKEGEGAKGEAEAEAPRYKLGGPCARAFGRQQRSRRKPKGDVVQACAGYLEELNKVALEALEEESETGERMGLAVEYTNMPEVMTEYIYHKHFGMEAVAKAAGGHIQHMEGVSRYYSKGMATKVEMQETQTFNQGMDLKYKDTVSDDKMKTTARSVMCQSYLSLHGMQAWVRPQTGGGASASDGTVGTCRSFTGST